MIVMTIITSPMVTVLTVVTIADNYLVMTAHCNRRSAPLYRHGAPMGYGLVNNNFIAVVPVEIGIPGR